ncbi:MAG: NAD(P)H-dependent oxidoreductase subunit E [Desulfomonile sp.]|nr:NAD(P)H-dependent oxidoreductase subunit E [Desulfomonile sp.]
MASECDITRLAEILGRFQRDRAILIPLLQEVQAVCGYIPPEAIEPVANHAGVFPSEVTGVISFYAQFYTSPRGRNVIKVCRGTACHVRGGRTVLQTVMKCTGIKDGETSEDMRFSLETVACLGACALSPVMVANGRYYGMLNPGRIEAILKDLP